MVMHCVIQTLGINIILRVILQFSGRMVWRQSLTTVSLSSGSRLTVGPPFKITMGRGGGAFCSLWLWLCTAFYLAKRLPHPSYHKFPSLLCRAGQLQPVSFSGASKENIMNGGVENICVKGSLATVVAAYFSIHPRETNWRLMSYCSVWNRMLLLSQLRATSSKNWRHTLCLGIKNHLPVLRVTLHSPCLWANLKSRFYRLA